jgi:hypothetical protein
MKLLTKNTAAGIRRVDHATPFIRKMLALTSPTCGCRSVGIVRSRTEATEFSFFLVFVLYETFELLFGEYNIFRTEL